jgi:4-hydroxy 2-oxovalerate aldolase
MSVALLDCTLRDGGYLLDKNWNDIDMHGIIGGLTEAGVDYVELGFLQNERNGESAVFSNSVDARKWIPADRKNTQYTAFADYSRYSADNLDEYDGKSFSCIRCCFFKEERKVALEMAQTVKDKGYKVFMQPVGILRYEHHELLDLIDDMNALMPDSVGMVDTFGSVYEEDLDDLFSFIHQTLDRNIAIDFHSHNNAQLSNGLSQHIVKIANGRRNIIVDATLFGMGRGIGNCPTELVVQYLNTKRGRHYNLDAILDIIDVHILPQKSKAEWGYDIPGFLAGAFSSHYNNVTYLQNKASLRSRDIRYILNRLTPDERSRYHYDRLDELYKELFSTDIDDTADFARLKELTVGKTVLIVAPGQTATSCSEQIGKFIDDKKPVVIAINFIPKGFGIDFVYFNNARRYDYWKNDPHFFDTPTIITSNVASKNDNGFVVSFQRVIKSGWNNFDNSTILLCRLADLLDANEIALAGFDGFATGADNYAWSELDKSSNSRKAVKINQEIEKMFERFMKSRTVQSVYFITPSRFDRVDGLTKYV